MRNLAVFLLFVCVIGLSFDLGSAIKCYSCVGAKGKKDNCEVAVKDVDTIDCTIGMDACWTLIAKDIITRSCTAKNACDLLDGATYSYCKTCTGDLCNTESAGFVPSYSTSLGVSIAFFAIMKMLM